jgi:hypothetical protein
MKGRKLFTKAAYLAVVVSVEVSGGSDRSPRVKVDQRTGGCPGDHVLATSKLEFEDEQCCTCD